MTINAKIIAVVELIALVVMGLFLFRSCGNGADIKAHADALDKKNDSLVKVVAVVLNSNDSLKVSDTIKTANAERKIDSLKKVIATQNAAFEVTRKTIIGLKHKLDSADKSQDTSDFYSACRELSNQLTEANNQLFAIQISNDSLSNVKDEEIVRQRGIITELQSELDQFKRAFAEEVNTNKQLTSDVDNLSRKAKRSSLLTKIGWGLAAIFGGGLLIFK